MFEINDGFTINITRGDIGAFTVDAVDEAGEKYLFQKGDVVRIKVTEKKACENVMFQKDFVVEEETEQVEIYLTEKDTKIGEVISKPTDYWYEVELNPLINPQTIIGYDEEGAKIFRLYPEGNDIEPVEPTPEDIPVVDEELDITSERPVQNQAITRAMLNLQEELERVENTKNITSEDLEPLAVGIEENKGNIAKNKGNIEDLINTLDTHTADKNNPHNVTAEQINCGETTVKGAIDKLSEHIGLSKYNYLPITINSGYVENGVTFTVNNDSSVTVTGKATAGTARGIGTAYLDAGEYIFSYEPVGTGNRYIYLSVNGTNYSNGDKITITTSGTKASAVLVVANGYTANDTFYPMIRPASIEDDTYEPYVADINTRLKHHDYLDIKDKITLSSSCESLYYAFVKNGYVHIKVSLNSGLSGNPTLFTVNDDEYKPLVDAVGNLAYTVSADNNKLINLSIGENGICGAWFSSAMTNRSFGYISYPLK